jgi:hypothetical protein
MRSKDFLKGREPKKVQEGKRKFNEPHMSRILRR